MEKCSGHASWSKRRGYPLYVSMCTGDNIFINILLKTDLLCIGLMQHQRFRMTDCHFLNLNIWLQKDSIQKVREYYKESNDIDGTLKQLPRHLVAERAIVSSGVIYLHSLPSLVQCQKPTHLMHYLPVLCTYRTKYNNISTGCRSCSYFRGAKKFQIRS